jgi:hypothetical protein
MTSSTPPITIDNSPRCGPIRMLVIGGLILIVAIAVGTRLMAGIFRERALNSTRRELENTVLLLARHFDQQFRDLGAIQQDFAAFVRSAGIDSGDRFKNRMSSPDIHLMLKANIGALSYVGNVTLFDSDGVLINSSGAWPVPVVNIGDRPYFRAFKTDPNAPDLLVEPVHSRISGAWTTLLARKLVAPNGAFLGVIGRGFEPIHFEKFFASVALGTDAAISMLHRNGTLLARYPHDDAVIGRNFRNGPLFRLIGTQPGPGIGIYVSPADGQERLGAAYALENFPIFVVASTTLSSALAPWREQMNFLIGVGGSSMLLIAALLGLAVRRLSRDHQRSESRLR